MNLREASPSRRRRSSHRLAHSNTRGLTPSIEFTMQDTQWYAEAWLYPSLRRQLARSFASSSQGPDPSAVKYASATPNDAEAWRLSPSTIWGGVSSLVTKTPAPPRLSLASGFIVVLLFVVNDVWSFGQYKIRQTRFALFKGRSKLDRGKVSVFNANGPNGQSTRPQVAT